MIRINKEEAAELRKKFKNPYIIRLCKKKSSRHHYYIASESQYINVIAELRGYSVKDVDKD